MDALYFIWIIPLSDSLETIYFETRLIYTFDVIKDSSIIFA